ncbi:hypothetical protein CCZ01_00020 [Helicobacter monodelphidis]|uniref:Uncharacterized protein n=1 Tax=Helicobacter didelphidarum TaxID=2040648 RepID=A0A3D8I3V4_9HELI|nr:MULTISPECIES: hypothetical protein [Helicobacter]RAX59172.1 hypothetical protein CCZ01_00020 [Helicobacter sp. 15-1451]RDU59695.1 hypothetical protein CQA53_11290 [Helicobacter didelphidarum]
MRYIVIILFCYGSLFAQIEIEENFTNTNIIEAYKQMKNSFSESYHLPQNIESMKNISQTIDNEESEIYGYRNFDVQWKNKNEVTISLNAFDDGERIIK